jgi:ammonium transporter, Amt family
MPRRLPKSPPRLRAWTRMFVGWALRGKRTVVGICTGAAAGLVAITPASGFVGPVGPMAIGVAAGIVCYWAAAGSNTCLA